MKDRRSNWQIVFVILIFAAWFGALPVDAQTKQDGKGVGVKVVSELPSKDKRWALIVGIDEYQNDVSTLKGSVNDAKALKNVLVNNAGFPENQVVLLTTDSFEQDKRPTRENILGALSDLYSRVPEDGLLLFSFSGHGISVGDQAFLIPSNGRFSKNPELLQDFAIDVSRIKRAIETMKVKQVLMLLDACRNEPGKGNVPNNLTNALAQGFSFDVANSDVKAFATLYATSIGERAFEFYDKDSKQFRGYFSYAVEEALKGKAANEKGEVTLSRLIDYLETTVPKKVKYDKGETQIPTANYSETYRANQLILAVAKLNKFDEVIQQSKPLPSPQKFVSNNTVTATRAATWKNLSNTARNLLKYDDVDFFYEGLAAAWINDKYGFIDETGQEVIPFKYDSVGSFSDGLAWAQLNNKAGFIDRTGREVIPFKYDGVGSFSGGLAEVLLNGRWGSIDKTGREIIPLKYGRDEPFFDGLARAVLDGKDGFKDKAGRVVIPFKYDNAVRFSEGLAGACLNFKCGFIDKTGREVIPFKYDVLPGLFLEGMAQAQLNGKSGFIDKTGREVIPFKYDTVDSFADGLARVRLNGKVGFINKTGREVIPIKYSYVWCKAFLKEGFIGVVLNGKQGFVDVGGNEYFDF